MLYIYIIGVVKLKRTYKSETIEVLFDCQDEVEDESYFNDVDMESAEEKDEKDEAEGTEGMMGLNFDVHIKKESGEKVVFNCIASRDLQISNIQHVPDGKNAEDSDLYSGPIFSELEESVQDAMKSYLADRQIDEDLCYFVLSFARAKEQREYIHWLNKLLTFSESK
jgi:complement component 1 Q subcomponent-binding protein